MLPMYSSVQVHVKVASPSVQWPPFKHGELWHSLTSRPHLLSGKENNEFIDKYRTYLITFTSSYLYALHK